MTTISVLYRDGANYKSYGHIVVNGPVTDEQVMRLRATLDGDAFIPEQVGMSHLGPSGWDTFPDEDDHCWHEMGDMTGDGDGDADGHLMGEYGTAEELISLFEKVGPSGWEPYDVCSDEWDPYRLDV